MELIGSLTVGKKTFSMKDSEGTVYLKQLGLPDNFYGGYAEEFRKTKYGIYLVLNRKLEIINLGYFKDKLTPEGKKLLGMVETSPEIENESLPENESFLEAIPFGKPKENLYGLQEKETRTKNTRTSRKVRE